MKNKTIHKIVSICLICITIIFSLSSNIYAYTSTNVGKNSYSHSGGFYLEINGGPNGNSRVFVAITRQSGANSYSEIMDKTSKWNLRISSGTNRHNIQLVDTQVSTKLDSTTSYNILPFRFAYDMPAHYQYSTYSADKPSGVRMNFGTYSKDDSGTNTASSSGSHATSTTKRTVSAQVNTGNTGLRTYKKINYTNCTLSMQIAKPTRTVTQNHYYHHISSGWTHFNTTSTNVVDGNWFAPFNVSAPYGYNAGNDYGYYNSSGASLGGGTVGVNGFSVCENNTVNVHYYPWKHTINYNPNGGNGTPSSQIKTYGASVILNSQKPTRTGYSFDNWNTSSSGNGTSYYSGGQYNADQNGGSITLYAKWNINKYTVRFIDRLTGNIISTQTISHGGNASEPTPPTNYGYTFNNWSTSATNITGNRDIYAEYKVSEYTIIFNSMGGSNVSSVKVKHNNVIPVQKPPTRNGYMFDGWYVSTNYDSQWNFNNVVTSNMTLYAKWIANPTIIANNRYFLENEEFTEHDILKNIIVNCEDQNFDITISGFKNDMIGNIGEYDLTVFINFSNRNETFKKDFKLHIVKTPTDEYLRSVSIDALYTITSSSVLFDKLDLLSTNINNNNPIRSFIITKK